MILSNSLSSSTLIRIRTTYKPTLTPARKARHVDTILQVGCRKTAWRGISVVTRAAPGTGVYIFAFVFPLSLLAITIFTSFRIADKLDQKFAEELAVNLAIMEAEEEDEEKAISFEEPVPTQRRNRPKREVESSSSV